jgi:tRNA modification GTPase
LNPGHFSNDNDTIVALATAPGTSAIAVLRVSGKSTFSILRNIFPSKDLSVEASHTVHWGFIRQEDIVIDEVLISIFKAPNSYTKEDVAEISCHGSEYITNKILKLLLKHGARYAHPGEYTKRAFLNGRFDLARAEAVADVIAADSEASHQTAINQMRGGFSKEIKMLREQLVNFASLVELELDFGEEDVEFADRNKLKELVYSIRRFVIALISSFDLGNVLKNGVPTVIAGYPNAGKSTLLNTLLNEDKAIVSEIPGTTRDLIEDEINLGGVTFRFIDTAGLRETVDKVEAIGIERTRQKMRQSSLIIYLFDVNNTTEKELKEDLAELRSIEIPYVVVGNKIDSNSKTVNAFKNFDGIVFISAAHKAGIDTLKDKLLEMVNVKSFKSGNVVVTNIRHYESLTHTREALDAILAALDTTISGDFLAQDIRRALHYLGEITGEITTDDLLENIFSKFCIGK